MQCRPVLLKISLTLSIFLMMVAVSFAASVSRMSTDELNERLGQEGLVVLDVRSPYHWGSTETKVLGAVRVVPGGVSEWASNYNKEDTIVLYCA